MIPSELHDGSKSLILGYVKTILSELVTTQRDTELRKDGPLGNRNDSMSLFQKLSGNFIFHEVRSVSVRYANNWIITMIFPDLLVASTIEMSYTNEFVQLSDGLSATASLPQRAVHAGTSFAFPSSGGRGRRYPGSGYTSPGARSIASNGSTDHIGCLTAVRMTALAKFNRYFRRLIRFRQMDFEFALWQMIYLLIKPQKVYRNFMYRKRTKDQWARDDPAFLVLLMAALAISSILFAWSIQLSFIGFITFFLWVVFIDCIGVGIVIATVLWFASNRFLKRVNDQDVEWAYCFDVHLNAFFPMLMLLHVLLPLTFSRKLLET
ncbi:unnamed protein product [Onchocerca ochengi]|uniref:Protein unc-50 n=1 Tax=Onchocerca ochengi TaxID=42157 RepID=A0A182EAN7_ONCOC|nr:unnamed protein product [Onchocerca ochengi]